MDFCQSFYTTTASNDHADLNDWLLVGWLQHPPDEYRYDMDNCDGEKSWSTPYTNDTNGVTHSSLRHSRFSSQMCRSTESVDGVYY